MTNRKSKATSSAPLKLRAARPEPQVRPLLKLLNMRVPTSDSVGAVRKGWTLLAVALSKHARVGRVTEYDIDGPNGKITLRVYLPRTGVRLLPALVWFHGGGFVVGSLESGDGTCRALATRSGAAVVAVDYRKCPEYDLYAGRNDAIEAITWLAANGAKVGVDATRLAVGGDSAGGNISAVAALHFARNQGPALRLQVLVYPATHLGAVYPSRAENGEGLFLTEEKIEWFTRLMGTPDFNDPLPSPILASSLEGVAPAVVVTAGFDPLRDEGLAYAERLRADGIAVESLHYPGQIHGFVSMDSALAQARHALDRIAKALAVALEPTDGIRAASHALLDSPTEPKAAARNSAYGNLLSRQLLANYQRGLNAFLSRLSRLDTSRMRTSDFSVFAVDRSPLRPMRGRAARFMNFTVQPLSTSAWCN